MTETHESIAFAGSGAVACTLGRLLIQSGTNVVAIASRTPENAERAAAFLGASVRATTFQELPAAASHIVIAVEDGAVASVAHLLATASPSPRVVVHTCGAKGPDILAELRSRGTACGVVHPLQTIPDPQHGVHALAGATFAIGGDAAAVEWADRLAARLGGTPMHVADDGFPLYHAGAVLAGNGAFALVETAVSMLAAAGVDRSRALEALAPLCRRSLENALTVGPGALTGPMARGSAETVISHMAALRARLPDAEPLYRTVALVLTELAKKRGLGDAAARTLVEALTP